MLKIKESYVKAKANILKREFAKTTMINSIWLVGDKIFTMIIGVFVTALIARYFGPEKYGQFSYAQSFVALFTALSSLGLETLTVKAIVDKDFDEGSILCTSLILRVLGGIVLTFFAALIIRTLEPEDANLHKLVFIMSLTMVFKSLDVIEYWIQAYQKAKISSIIRMVTYVITSILKVLLVFLNGNLINYAAIFMLNSIVIGFSLIIAYFKIRQNKSGWRFSFIYAKNILSQSWYLILSGLMVTIYMKIDQIMLGSMLPQKSDLGIYSAAVQIAQMWYFVPMALITSFTPIIMNKKRNKDKDYLKSVQTLYSIVSCMSIIFVVLIMFFSKTIVNVLFGQEYIKASSILYISIWAGTFAMLGSARSTWLICEGLQKYSMIYIGSGAIINVILNFYLIPVLGGYGAAIATLGSQVTVAIIVPSFFKETRISSIMLLKSFKLEGIINQKKKD